MEAQQIMINKISTAKVIGPLENVKEKRTLFTVMGIAKSFRVGSSQFGDFVELSGNFKAVVDTAEGQTVYSSSKAFLPEMAVNLIADALQEPENDSVQFAFEVGVKPASNPIGYEYWVSHIIKPVETDAMGELMAKVSAHKAHALTDDSAEKSTKAKK